jgi:hypothetical protein
MLIIYFKLYHVWNTDLPLPKNLFDRRYEIEHIKCAAPDDGEVLTNQGRFGVACPDGDWASVVEKLRQSGVSLVYSVVRLAENGEISIVEAGELNSEVRHYTTQNNDGKQIFMFWFEDCLPRRRTRLTT